MSKDEIIAEKDATIASLKSQLATLQKLVFGQKSERFVADETPVEQIGLFTDSAPVIVEPQAVDIITYGRKKPKPHPGRHRLPDHLPVELRIIEPEEDTTGMKCIGKDITETLDYHPAKLIRIRYERPKYVKTDDADEQIIIGKLPNRPIDKGLAEAGLLSHFIVSKFIDHLPFYRQLKMIKRDHQLEIPSSTVNDWFINCCTLLEPLYNKLKETVIQSDYLQVDESPIKVLESEKKGKTHQGYQWVYHAVEPGVVLFNYRKGRGQNGPKEILEHYSGYLQCDGYTVYDKIGSVDHITLIGCLAHARRYFYDARDSDAERAHYVLSKIQEIYKIEKRFRNEELPITQRKVLLDPILIELKEWIDEQANSVLPKSPIGKAMTYFVRQWPKLKKVTSEDWIKLDNNLIENKIRPLALGRKNYLFAGNHASAQRIAMMYSFFATCSIHNVNPREWLRNALQRLPDHPINQIHLLLPNNWS